MKHLALNISVFLGSLLFLFLISQIVIAFTSPTLPPPDGNVPPPLQEGINPNVLDITGTAINERDITLNYEMAPAGCHPAFNAGSRVKRIYTCNRF